MLGEDVGYILIVLPSGWPAPLLYDTHASLHRCWCRGRGRDGKRGPLCTSGHTGIHYSYMECGATPSPLPEPVAGTAAGTYTGGWAVVAGAAVLVLP